ncbi:MAG: BPSS1780 family membrane protein, partial [Thiothrix sp.]
AVIYLPAQWSGLYCGGLMATLTTQEQSTMNDNNPYQPPRIDVTPPSNASGDFTLLPEPRSLPLGAALDWFVQSWSLVKASLVTWVLITLVFIGIQFFMRFVPIAGDIVSTLLGPVFTGGILLGIHELAKGGELRFDHLFVGFKQRFVPLLTLGAVTLGVMLLFAILLGGAFVGVHMDTLRGTAASAEDLFSGINTGLLALAVLLMLFVAMLFWFATQLVALNDVPVRRALSMSLQGCLRNPLPLITLTLLATPLVILGMIPLGLGLLIVLPWLFVIAYVSYRHIFIQ